MKRAGVITTFALALTALAIAQTPPTSTPSPQAGTEAIAKTLIDLEKQSWEAWKGRDGGFFSRFLSDDHVEVGFGGRTDKANVIAGVASPVCVVASYAVDDFRVVVFEPNVALVTYRAEQDTRCNGNPVPSPAWASSLYVKRGERWENAAYQQTQILGKAKS
jgi:Domain of unknown function (DUF4440)